MHEKPQRDFYRRLAGPVKDLIRLPGFHHETIGERDRHLALAPIRAFVERLFAAPFAAPPQPLDVCDAERCGAIFGESKALARPLAWWTPHGAYWALTRVRARLRRPWPLDSLDGALQRVLAVPAGKMRRPQAVRMSARMP